MAYKNHLEIAARDAKHERETEALFSKTLSDLQAEKAARDLEDQGRDFLDKHPAR